MNNKQKNISLIVAVNLLLIAGIYFLFQLRQTDVSGMADMSQSPGYAIYPAALDLAPFQLEDQYGQNFANEQLKGKWTLVFFGFSSCQDVCPLTLFELKKFYTALSSSALDLDTQIAMVSVDPARDTAEVLNQYMASFHPDFIGLTGSLDTISSLANGLYISRMDPPDQHQHGDHATANYQVEHSAHIAVIDPDARYHAVIMAPHTDQSLLSAYQAIRDQ